MRAATRVALWVGIASAVMLAGAGIAQSQFKAAPAPAPTPVPRVVPTPLPPLPNLGTTPTVPTPAQPLPQTPRMAAPPPAATAPPAAAPARPIRRASLVKALSVAGNRECDITATLQQRCRVGQSCKLSCSPSHCPQLGGQTFCEFFVNCAVEFVARVVMDDPVCKPSTEVRLVDAPGGGRYHLIKVPVGYDCDPPQCVQ
jgi:hypothetical protein